MICNLAYIHNDQTYEMHIYIYFFYRYKRKFKGYNYITTFNFFWFGLLATGDVGNFFFFGEASLWMCKI